MPAIYQRNPNRVRLEKVLYRSDVQEAVLAMRLEHMRKIQYLMPTAAIHLGPPQISNAVEANKVSVSFEILDSPNREKLYCGVGEPNYTTEDLNLNWLKDVPSSVSTNWKDTLILGFMVTSRINCQGWMFYTSNTISVLLTPEDEEALRAAGKIIEEHYDRSERGVRTISLC